MQAGQLRNVVMLQQRSTSLDSHGQQVTTWSNLFPGRANIEPLSSRELLASQAVQNELSHRITMRYRSEFATPIAAAGWRIVYKGRYFNLSGVQNLDERNRTVELMATEGLNDG